MAGLEYGPIGAFDDEDDAYFDDEDEILVDNLYSDEENTGINGDAEDTEDAENEEEIVINTEIGMVS